MASTEFSAAGAAGADAAGRLNRREKFFPLDLDF